MGEGIPVENNSNILRYLNKIVRVQKGIDKSVKGIQTNAKIELNCYFLLLLKRNT